MNTAAIYAKTTGQEAQPSDEEIKQETAQLVEEQNIKASKEQWRRHPVTQQFFLSILHKAEECIDNATKQAMSYHEHKNPDLIIKNLIQAEVLKQLSDDSQ